MKKFLISLLTVLLVSGCAELKEVNEIVTDVITEANQIIMGDDFVEEESEDIVEPVVVPSTPIEDVLLEGLKEKKSSIDVSAFKMGEDKFKEVYQKVVYDNPQLFWIANDFTYSYMDNGVITNVKPTYFDTGNVETYENAVSEALKVVDEDMYDAEIALVLHDYLALNVSYDGTVDEAQEEVPASSYNSYGALVNQVAVCQGYSLAYVDLLKRCNLEAHYVSSEEMNHGWVQVKIEGEWYHVDVTWDDVYPDIPGAVKHDYFLKSDATLATGEKPHYGWKSEYICNKNFEGIWENAADAAIYVQRHQMVYVAGETGTIRLMYKNYNTGDEKTLVEMNEHATWYAQGDFLMNYYDGIFTRMIPRGGKLYFNTAEDIYSLNLSNSEVVKLTSIDTNRGYLYGFDFKNSQIRMYITFDPNDDQRMLTTIDLN